MQRRNTPNKKQILTLFENSHTLTAQAICEQLPELEVSTVYRNVDRFVADGILRKVYVEANAAAYELAEDAHNHFVCDGCNVVEAIDTPKALSDVVPQGAHVSEGGVTVRGVCKACNNN